MFLYLCETVFFGVFGINTFWPFAAAEPIMGVAAIIIAIIFIVNVSRYPSDGTTKWL